MQPVLIPKHLRKPHPEKQTMVIASRQRPEVGVVRSQPMERNPLLPYDENTSVDTRHAPVQAPMQTVQCPIAGTDELVTEQDTSHPLVLVKPSSSTQSRRMLNRSDDGSLVSRSPLLSKRGSVTFSCSYGSDCDDSANANVSQLSLGGSNSGGPSSWAVRPAPATSLMVGSGRGARRSHQSSHQRNNSSEFSSMHSLMESLLADEAPKDEAPQRFH